MYIDLYKGGEDVKLQSAVDIVKESDFSLHQFNTILQKIHDNIIFSDCADIIEPLDEPDLWADYQIALNSLETATYQFQKVVKAIWKIEAKHQQNRKEIK